MDWFFIEIPTRLSLTKDGYTTAQVPPVSENKMYATNWDTKRRFKTDAARIWKETIAWCAKNKARPTMGKGSEMFLEIFLTFPPAKRKRDPGNYVKPIADALTGIVWDDDSGLKIIADGEIGHAWMLKIRWGLK